MKKICSKLIAAILCLAMCFSLAGCNADLKTILMVKETYDAIMKVNSFDFSASAEASSTAWNEDLNFTVKAEGSYIVDPAIGELNGELDLGEQGKFSAPVYFRDLNGTLEFYIGLALGSATVWFKQSAELTEKALAGDLESVVEYLKSVAAPTRLEEEKEINGNMAEGLSLTIPGSIFMQTDETGAVIEGEKPIEDLTVTAWIDEKTSLPLRLEGDVAGIVQYYLDTMDKDIAGNISVKSLPVTIDLSNYNGVYSIKLPSGTSKAIDLMEFINDNTALLQEAAEETPAPSATVKPTPTAKPAVGDKLPEGASVWKD